MPGNGDIYERTSPGSPKTGILLAVLQNLLMLALGHIFRLMPNAHNKMKPEVYIADAAIRNGVLMLEDVLSDPTLTIMT
ncbi:MAG: hypothetical protein AB1815_12860 [Bacillota bacterium]